MKRKSVLFIIANAMILLCGCRTNDPAMMVRKEINTAQISNMNMLRVWGGGIYENDEIMGAWHQWGWKEKADSGFNIHLVTDKLAKNVFLQIGDEEGFFSDDYFDMLPGEEVLIQLETDIPEPELRKVLSIRTLDNVS